MNTTETNTQKMTLDIPLQASNIDNEGNVLYLDQERLDRKKVGLKRYKNKSNGLGIKNFLVSHVLYFNKKRWPLALKLYRFFMKYTSWLRAGGLKAKIYKNFIKINPTMERNTGALTLPLNVDVTKGGEKVVVPMDLLKETLKKIDYIAGMDTCLCREANGCKDYPIDLGCLFFGQPARSIVKHNLGREITYEEACERIDKAAEHGLMAQALWIEFEQLLWSVRNDQMDNFLEVCFCCPCCCIATRLSRNLSPEEHIHFHPSGWTAVPDRTRCVGCGLCAQGPNGCPVSAIKMGPDHRVMINQDVCVGCGICKNKCKFGVISIKQTMPMRKDIGEYFDQEFNIGLKVWKTEEDQK